MRRRRWSGLRCDVTLSPLVLDIHIGDLGNLLDASHRHDATRVAQVSARPWLLHHFSLLAVRRSLPHLPLLPVLGLPFQVVSQQTHTHLAEI